jgi:hypothetical protein
MRWLLLVEATHYGRVLDDTGDLSTRRGGSLLLLHVVDRIAGDMPDAVVLSRGASSLVLMFDVASDAEGEKRTRNVRRRLVADGVVPKAPKREQVMALARHATFSVAGGGWPAGEAFHQALLRLRNELRLASLRAPTLAVTWGSGADACNRHDYEVVCARDHVRPASVDPERTNRRRRTDPGFGVSDSVFERRGYGLHEKQRFYAQEYARRRIQPARLATDRFASNLHDFEDPKADHRLRGKIAVLYLDGNRFSAIQEAVSKAGESQLQAFDGFVRERRFLLLDALLRLLETHEDSAIGSGDTEKPQAQGEFEKTERFVKLETLLWGGDELMWVVPANLGVEVARVVFTEAGIWRIDDYKLTHAVGLVFCHNDAPIGRVQALARELAESTKRPEVELERQETALAYAVMESFDFPPGGLATMPGRRALGAEAWRLNEPAWESLVETGRALKDAGLPRRQLKELARLAAVNADTTPTRERLADAYGALEDRLDAIETRHGAAGWLHLDQLWDYLPAPTSRAGRRR